MAKKDLKVLSIVEASRALCIDFEGRKDRPPVLLGATRFAPASRVHQYVTDMRYASIATDGSLEAMSLGGAVERIIQRAEKGDRLIVAWTNHELEIVRRYVPELADRFERRYRNALVIAKYWRNARHGGAKPVSGALVGYLGLVDYRVPEAAGVGRAAETIRRLDDAFERGKTASQLTPNLRQRWVDLRAHNAHDCAGMRRVCLATAEDVAAQDKGDG